MSQDMSPLEMELAVIEQQAKLLGDQQSKVMLAIARVVRALACYNREEQVRYNDLGAFVMPSALLKQSAFALGKDSLGRAVFCVLFQNQFWQDIKELHLFEAYLYPENRQIILRFMDMPIGEFKLPFFDLAIPVVSDALWYQLETVGIAYLTIGMVEHSDIIPGKLACRELQEEHCYIRSIKNQL